MNRTAFALSMVAIVATAAWAYSVNYRTGEALDRVAALEAEIAREKQRIAVLAVEWAHLNRPERLRALVEAHNAELALMPLATDHFGKADDAPGGRP